jgi:hypothetical protein
MRWQSASDQQAARDIWHNTVEWLDRQPSLVLPDAAPNCGAELVVQRVEDRRVIEERNIVVGDDTFGPSAPAPALAQADSVSQLLPLSQAAERAPFPLYAPRQVPEHWSAQARFLPSPAIVVLDYQAAGKTVVAIAEALPSTHMRFATPHNGPSWNHVEIGSSRWRVRGPSEDWPHCEIELTRSGTAISLISSTLARDDLEALGAALAPLRPS